MDVDGATSQFAGMTVGPEGFDEGDDEDGPMIVDLSVPFVSFS